MGFRQFWPTPSIDQRATSGIALRRKRDLNHTTAYTTQTTRRGGRTYGPSPQRDCSSPSPEFEDVCRLDHRQPASPRHTVCLSTAGQPPCTITGTGRAGSAFANFPPTLLCHPKLLRRPPAGRSLCCCCPGTTDPTRRTWYRKQQRIHPAYCMPMAPTHSPSNKSPSHRRSRW